MNYLVKLRLSGSYDSKRYGVEEWAERERKPLERRKPEDGGGGGWSRGFGWNALEKTDNASENSTAATLLTGALKAVSQPSEQSADQLERSTK